MNNCLIIICLIIDILICFGIPLGYLIYIIVNKRQNIKFYFVGVCAFTISQVFLRLPILNKVLPNMTWFLTMENFYPIIYCIFCGITAGLFEETARFIGFKAIIKGKDKIDWSSGVAFGIGHGGIEAILITGFNCIAELIKVINSNTDLSGSVTVINALMPGVERLLAMTVHVGLTLLVLYGIKVKSKRYLVLAIFIHGVIDSFSGIIPALGFNIYLVEVWCAIWAIGLLIFAVKAKKLLKGDGVLNEKTI